MYIKITFTLLPIMIPPVWCHHQYIGRFVSGTHCHRVRFDDGHLQSVLANHQKIRRGKCSVGPEQQRSCKLKLLFVFNIIPIDLFLIHSVVGTVQREWHSGRWYESTNSHTVNSASQSMWIPNRYVLEYITSCHQSPQNQPPQTRTQTPIDPTCIETLRRDDLV